MNGAEMDNPNLRPDVPYRLAAEIQAHIVREASMYDYTLGQAERGDMAIDYTQEVLVGRVEPPSLAYDAMTLWFNIYGGVRYHG